MAKEKHLEAMSGFGQMRGPFVTLLLNGEQIIQMSVAEARHHAMCVLAAAESAETDGFIAEYVHQNFVDPGASPEVALTATGVILRDFRAYRDKSRKKGLN